jgi:hypothetical protein
MRAEVQAGLSGDFPYWRVNCTAKSGHEMLDKRPASVLFTILVFAAALAILYEARRPFLLLIFSVLFAYLLEPFVSWFQNRLGSRTRGIAATYLTLAFMSPDSLWLRGPGSCKAEWRAGP